MIPLPALTGRPHRSSMTLAALLLLSLTVPLPALGHHSFAACATKGCWNPFRQLNSANPGEGGTPSSRSPFEASATERDPRGEGGTPSSRSPFEASATERDPWGEGVPPSNWPPEPALDSVAWNFMQGPDESKVRAPASSGRWTPAVGVYSNQSCLISSSNWVAMRRSASSSSTGRSLRLWAGHSGSPAAASRMRSMELRNMVSARAYTSLRVGVSPGAKRS